MSAPKTKGVGRGIQFLRAHLKHRTDECLIWPLYRDDYGYGIVGYNGKTWKAHRLMCVLVHGEPPTPKHQAAHECGNGDLGCVNPRHLKWKTNSENQYDSALHGTSARKPGAPRFKLTEEKVAQIRALKGKMTAIAMAPMFGVSPDAIEKVLNFTTWKTGKRIVNGFDARPLTRERRNELGIPRR